jgi:hypothetical protein
LPEDYADYDRWVDVLEELESALAAVAGGEVEGALTAGATWSAPRDLGPIPEDLVDRATQLAAAQQTAIRKLQAAVRQNRKQSALLETVPTSGSAGRAVYLDVNG